jgi:hypothetical protein
VAHVDAVKNPHENDDPIVAAIHDIYRDGAEAGLRHVERAIEWRHGL